MKCTGCGSELPPGIKFCGHCGAPVPPSTTAQPSPPTGKRDGTVLAPQVTAWLVIESGTAKGQSFRLGGTTSVGRSQENDIYLIDPRISRQHAVISQEAFGYTVKDLGSAGGTFLNGERIIGPRGLREGDRIQVGNTTLNFSWQPSAEGPQPPHAPALLQAQPYYGPTPVPPVARKSIPRVPIVLGALGVGLLILVAVAAILLFGGSDKADVPVVTQIVTSTASATTAPTNTPIPTDTPVPTDTPIPTATPIPEPVSVRVAEDGSGDYPDLETAVEVVPPRSTITLDPGIYQLTASLAITKSLSLRGAGMDQTFVISTQGEQVVRFVGPGSFAAEGITFRYAGTDWAHVMTIEDGEIDIAGCRFVGAIWSEGEGKGGSGLFLRGNTIGNVRDCHMEGNELHGIEIQGESQPTLEGNLATDNQHNGIAYWDDTGGIARQNKCSGNGYHGISISEQAQPTLEENLSTRNGETGIRYSGTAGGLARGNESTENGLHGIVVVDEAQPTLEENVCNRNIEGSGIVYFDQAGGVARRNKANRNGLHGIELQDQAQPTLEENTCWQNSEIGIFYTSSAGGTARRNECNANSLHGIAVRDEANPMLEGNTCRNNALVGIRFAGSSRGTARQNTCQRNGLNGIAVKDQARPTLEGNVCIDNAEAGIRYSDNAGGVAQGNTCKGNQWGIYVEEGANPDLQDNESSGNSVADIVVP